MTLDGLRVGVEYAVADLDSWWRGRGRRIVAAPRRDDQECRKQQRTGQGDESLRPQSVSDAVVTQRCVENSLHGVPL